VTKIDQSAESPAVPTSTPPSTRAGRRDEAITERNVPQPANTAIVSTTTAISTASTGRLRAMTPPLTAAATQGAPRLDPGCRVMRSSADQRHIAEVISMPDVVTLADANTTRGVMAIARPASGSQPVPRRLSSRADQLTKIAQSATTMSRPRHSAVW